MCSYSSKYILELVWPKFDLRNLNLFEFKFKLNLNIESKPQVQINWDFLQMNSQVNTDEILIHLKLNSTFEISNSNWIQTKFEP